MGSGQRRGNAELGLDGRALFGDVTVVGEEAFDVGQIEVNMTSGGVADGNLILNGEVVADIKGFMKRGGILEGSFQTITGEKGEWLGEWYGVAPTVDNGWVAETPQASPDEPSGTVASAQRGRTIRAVVVEMNRLNSAVGDNPGPFGNHQVEVEVAVDRSGNSNRVATTSIDAYQYPNVTGLRPDLAYYISNDGGDTWPASLQGNLPGLTGREYGADPVMEYDRNGDLFYCGLAWIPGPVPQDQWVFLSRMPQGTSAFQNAEVVRSIVPADNRDLDKPWCTTGLTDEPTPRDIVYVVYSNNAMNPNPDVTSIDFGFSIDGGPILTFTGVADSTDSAWPQAAVGIDKKLNVVWVDNNTPDFIDIKFDQCEITFSPFNVACGTDVPVAAAEENTAMRKPPIFLVDEPFEMSWFPYLAVDNAPGGSGFIYVVWNALESAGADTGIYFSRSDWVNIDFSPPVRIVNTAQDDFFPAISVDENHFIRVVYYHRVSMAAEPFDVYEIFSGDAGNSWSAPTKINDAESIDPLNQSRIGDYIGIDTKIERHPGWMDSRGAGGGDFDVYSAVVAGC